MDWYTAGMIDALRLTFHTLLGGFAGWLGYIILKGFTDYGMRCSDTFEPEDHLAFTVSGALSGTIYELLVRWRERRTGRGSPEMPPTDRHSENSIEQ